MCNKEKAVLVPIATLFENDQCCNVVVLFNVVFPDTFYDDKHVLAPLNLHD